jgi:hypothetical protein
MLKKAPDEFGDGGRVRGGGGGGGGGREAGCTEARVASLVLGKGKKALEREGEVAGEVVTISGAEDRACCTDAVLDKGQG